MVAKGPERSASADPALVILAAGASRRLGQCKALARLGPRTVLARLLEAAADGLGATPALVVTGAQGAEIAAAGPWAAELLANPDWAAGRTRGLALAAAHLAGRDLCVAPVDVPLVPAEVFAGLAGAWRAAGAPPRGWLAPRCGERFGHPLILGRELVASLATWDADRPLKELRALAQPLLAWPTERAEVLDDLDTPADLERLRRRILRG